MIVNEIGYEVGEPNRYDIVVFHAPETCCGHFSGVQFKCNFSGFLLSLLLINTCIHHKNRFSIP